MVNEIDLKKEVNVLKTEKALNKGLKYVEAIRNWINENTLIHIGLFTDIDDINEFKYILNNEDLHSYDYEIVNNMLDKIINDTDNYFYLYDGLNNDLTILNINDKYNGLILSLNYFVGALYPNQTVNYYKFISDII